MLKVPFDSSGNNSPKLYGHCITYLSGKLDPNDRFSACDESKFLWKRLKEGRFPN